MIYLRKIFTHPLFIILLFCGITVSGEQIGGFYLFYILLGLPHFALHAVLGILGIACLMFTYYNKTIIVSLLRVLGATFMIASLLYFFMQRNGSYNYNTLHEAFPLITLIVFTIVIVVFILTNIFALFNSTHKKEHDVT